MPFCLDQQSCFMLFDIVGSTEWTSSITGHSDAAADSATAIACPRLISREAAASYICVSPNTFDEMVKKGQNARSKIAR
jgi:hypothetical protein